jgi:hypothetical protein
MMEISMEHVMAAKPPFDLAPTGRPNEWAVTVPFPGYPDNALSAVVESGGRGVLGVVDRTGKVIDRIVVPGGARAETVRTTFRNGVLDASFETLRPMPPI